MIDKANQPVPLLFDFNVVITNLNNMTAKSSLTILFEDPFWVGLYECVDDGKYEVCKITFGAEPKDYEVYDFLLKNWHKLKVSPSVQADKKRWRKRNPKRMQREINSQLENWGIDTKAQQALKLLRKQSKVEKKTHNKEQKEAEKERKYALRQEKKNRNIEGDSIYPLSFKTASQ